jgi:hypothetical protein
MAGFNLGSLQQGLLDEIMADVKSELSALRTFEQFCDVRPVDKRKSSIYLWNTPLEIASDGNRTSKVAPGANTPEGNSALDTREYKCDDFKYQQALEEGAEKEIQSVDDVRNKLALNASQKVLLDFNKEIKNILDGTDTTQSFTEKAVSNPWDGASGTPIDDIDDVLKALRGVGQVDCVMGYDVMQALSRNDQITGAGAGSGNEFVLFNQVVQYLMSRGVARIFVDGSTVQNGEINYARSYAGVYDGVFSLFQRGNLMVPDFQQLRADVYEDRNKDVTYFKAKHSKDVIRGYEAHGYYFSSILT